MLTVHLYPAEFIGMLGFLSRVSAAQLDVPLRYQPATMAVLMDYQSRLSLSRVFAWRSRKTDRLYKHNLPVPVAVALHLELKKAEIDHDQQSFLLRLDKAITDYQLPMPQRLALTTNLFYAATA